MILVTVLVVYRYVYVVEKSYRCVYRRYVALRSRTGTDSCKTTHNYQTTSNSPISASLCYKCEVEDPIRTLRLQIIKYMSLRGRVRAIPDKRKELATRFLSGLSVFPLPSFQFLDS